jgi:hypothetical protein
VAGDDDNGISATLKEERSGRYKKRVELAECTVHRT